MKNKSKIYSLHPYKTPLDYVHCTMNVTTCDQELYMDDWDENMKPLRPTICCTDLICGKEGVAAAVSLNPWLSEWFELSEYSAPHVTLAVGHGFEARGLGLMVKRTQTLEWMPTTDPAVMKA